MTWHEVESIMEIKDFQGKDTRRAPEFEIDSNIEVWFWTAVINHLRMNKIELPQKPFFTSWRQLLAFISCHSPFVWKESSFTFFVLDKFTTTVTEPGILRSLAWTPHQRWGQVPSGWSWTRRGSRSQTSGSSSVRQKGTRWCRSCTWTWRYLHDHKSNIWRYLATSPPAEWHWRHSYN